MTADLKKHTFAKLEIAIGDKARSRVINFSRAQFEVCMVLVPAIAIWGLVSTGLLFWHLTLQSNVVVAKAETTLASPPASIALTANETVAVTAQKTPAKTSLEASTKTKLGIYVATRFKVDDVFAVSAKINEAGTRGPFSITLAIENLTGAMERGHFWVRINAVDKNGRDMFLYSSPAILIGTDGRSQNPRKGVSFAFQNALNKSLSLYGDNELVAELKSLEVGFDRGSRGQSLATVPLTAAAN